MVRVNGKKFTIYDLDTAETIKNRIAAKLDTIPKYLYFEEEIPLDLKFEDIKVDNLLRRIKRSAKKSTQFSVFLEEIRPKLSKDINVKKDVLYVWLAYNTQLEKLAEINRFVLVQVGEKLVAEEYFVNDSDFNNFWERDREGVKERLNRAIEINKGSVKRQEKLAKTFSDVDDDDAWIYTPFKTERVELEIGLNLNDISLLELFNRVVTNEAVPFATASKYYKILKDYVPPEEWSYSEDDKLLLKVSDKERVVMNNVKEYIDVKISVEGEIGNEDVRASTKLNIIRGNLSQDKFIKRFLKTFHGKQEITYDPSKTKETGVVGVFYFPQKILDSYVFSDLVMNDNLFSQLLSINESLKASKRLTESGQTWLHVHFNHPSIGHIGASITQKIVQRNDPELKGEEPAFFPPGSYYIRLRVNGKDKASVEGFQEIFAKLMALYTDKYDEIIEIYRSYLGSDFGVIEEEEIRELDMSKPENIAPEIFVKNYSRNCLPPTRIPTIIGEDETTKFTEEGKEVMKFPRDIPKEGASYPSDGVNQQYYVCMDPKYKYPGLQINKLANREDYPYVPCCFSTAQAYKMGGVYRHYFHGEELVQKKDKKQQDLIKTDKILGPDKFGFLPSSVDSLLELIHHEAKYKYVRLGVHRNFSSFLDTVMVALDEQTNILQLTDADEREARLNDVRDQLATAGIAPLCRQSVYDSKIEIAQENIADPEVYFDPKLYLQLLEGYFNCNIFLFTREGMILPRHLQSYYKRRTNFPYILVYEHWGSESDHAQYPQCELIVRWHETQSKNVQYVFPADNELSQGVDTVFELLRKSYSLDKPIYETVFNWRKAVPIVSQRIDSYGKCRQLNVEYRGNNVTVLTSPMPPLKVVETRDPVIHVTPFEIAMRMLNKLKATVIKQTVQKGILKEIVAQLGTITLTVPVQDSTPLSDVPKQSELAYPDSTFSSITRYNRNKKLARYIVEYVYWLFSRFFKESGREHIDDEIISLFAKSQIIIDPEFQYGNVKKRFSRKSGLMKDKKLVVKSEDMLKRLMYVLKLYSVRDTNTLVSFRSRNVIQNYYQDITDFKSYPSQVILQGEESIEKWIQESKISYRLYNGIQIGIRTPYFFKNELISNKVFLAQNVPNAGYAVYIARMWKERGYNAFMYAEEIPITNFTLYSYSNENQIVPYQVTGTEDVGRVRIIGYSISGTPYFTVLLPLS